MSGLPRPLWGRLVCWLFGHPDPSEQWVEVTSHDAGLIDAFAWRPIRITTHHGRRCVRCLAGMPYPLPPTGQTSVAVPHPPGSPTG